MLEHALDLGYLTISDFYELIVVTEEQDGIAHRKYLESTYSG